MVLIIYSRSQFPKPIFLFRALTWSTENSSIECFCTTLYLHIYYADSVIIMLNTKLHNNRLRNYLTIFIEIHLEIDKS